MDHYSRFAPHSQVNTYDAAGVTALFTDAVAAYVDQQARASIRGVPDAEGAVRETSNTYATTTHTCATDAVLSRTENGSISDTASLQYLHSSSLRCDPELARIAVALHFAALLHLWVILRQMCRESRYNGFTRDAIRAAFTSYGVPFSERNLSRWLHRGHGLFWQLDPGAKLVYPASPVTVALNLLRHCKRFNLHDLYITNYPGQRRDMFIDVSGNTRAFERHVYEAWMASRNNPTISRWTLERLWNRTAVSLRALEKGSHIQVVTNYAFCDMEFSDYVPFDMEGERRADVKPVTIDGRRCWQWQISNTYHAPTIRQHDKRGVSRRVYYTVKIKYPEIQATSASDAGAESLGSLNRSHKMFYDSREKARSNANQHGEMIRYALLGYDDGNRGLFEVTPDGGTRFEFWSCAETLRRRGVHSSAMCDKVMACEPF